MIISLKLIIFFRTLKTEKIKKILNSNENLYEILSHALSSLRLVFLSENDLEEGSISINLKCHKRGGIKNVNRNCEKTFRKIWFTG